MAARRRSGMDNGVGAESRPGSVPEGVAGCSKMTTSMPLQPQCARVVELCWLFFPRPCANVFSFSFFHSISLSPPLLGLSWTNTNSGNRPNRPSLRPTTIARFSPPTTPPSVVSSANLNYCPAPTVSRLNAGVHISVNAFSRHTFLRLSSSPPITVRQPIVADPCLCEP